MPKQTSDQAGNFFASSGPSQSFTPVQRAHTAVVGCSLFGRNQPSCRANTAATPDASTNQRAETVRVIGELAAGTSEPALGCSAFAVRCSMFPWGILTSTI